MCLLTIADRRKRDRGEGMRSAPDCRVGYDCLQFRWMDGCAQRERVKLSQHDLTITCKPHAATHTMTYVCSTPWWKASKRSEAKLLSSPWRQAALGRYTRSTAVVRSCWQLHSFSWALSSAHSIPPIRSGPSAVQRGLALMAPMAQQLIELNTPHGPPPLLI